jgi:hypothetical protein
MIMMSGLFSRKTRMTAVGGGLPAFENAGHFALTPLELGSLFG